MGPQKTMIARSSPVRALAIVLALLCFQPGFLLAGHQNGTQRLLLPATSVPSEKASISAHQGHPAQRKLQEQSSSADPTCISSRREKIKSYLNTVVLIIHINYAWAANMTAWFWREVYKDLFQDIVVISEEAIPELGVEARGPKGWASNWRLCYYGLPEIMARYPKAQGFLWTNDDVVINYWNLLGANKSRLWMMNDERHFDVRWFPMDPNVDTEWTADWAADPNWRKAAIAAFIALDEPAQLQYSVNIQPRRGEYPKRIMDLYYVPQRHVAEFSRLVPVFLRAGLPSELALPFIFFCLDHPSQFDPVLDSMVLRWDLWWGRGDHFSPKQAWSPHIAGLHPWKVSRNEAKRELVQALQTGDPCLRMPDFPPNSPPLVQPPPHAVSAAEPLPPGWLAEPVIHQFQAIGFVTYSAFRISPSRFAILGLGVARAGPSQRLRGMEKQHIRSKGCHWMHPQSSLAWVKGSLSITSTLEHHHNRFETLVLFCDLEKSTDSVYADEAERDQGGYLQVQLGYHGFVPYIEAQHTPVHESQSQGPFTHKLVFCGAPIHGNVEARSVTQWMDYHLYYAGFQHLFVYDAGGIDSAMRSQLARFVGTGVLSIVNFTGVQKFETHYHGQALAQHDCMFRNRESAEWVAFLDFDEYLEILLNGGTASLHSVLQWAQEQTPPVAWLSHGRVDYELICPEGSSQGHSLWGGLGREHFAVEALRTRHRQPMCQSLHPACARLIAEVCSGFCGRRKVIVNPRVVEILQIHNVYQVAGDPVHPSKAGVDLRASYQLRHGHFRGLTMEEMPCRASLGGMPVSDVEQGSLIAEVAQRARQCAEEKGVPSWMCKEA